jgi:hypothetical protein
MKKDTRTLILVIGFIVAVSAGIAYFQYWAWEAAHPDAPLWSFFLGRLQ